MENIISIHGQTDTREILNESNQIEYLDEYVSKTNLEFNNIYSEYKTKYLKYTEVIKELKKLKELGTNNLQRLDMINFQINEIESSNISIEDEENLEKEYMESKNFEEIYDSFSDTKYIFTEVLPKLYDLMDVTNILKDFKPNFDEINKVITNSYYELEEAYNMVKKEQNSIVEYSKEDIIKLENRIDTYNLMKQKYGSSTKKVLEFLNKIKEEKDSIENKNDKIFELENEKSKLVKELEILASKITIYRKEESLNISNLVNIELKDLEMKNADFKILINPLKEFNFSGKDEISFVIRTNKGDIHKELSKIASGRRNE